jgi:hypothetical protein
LRRARESLSDSLGSKGLFEPSRQREVLDAKNLWDDILESGILTKDEIGIFQDKAKGYKEAEIDKNRFGGRRATFYTKKRAQEKVRCFLKNRESKCKLKMSDHR